MKHSVKINKDVGFDERETDPSRPCKKGRADAAGILLWHVRRNKDEIRTIFLLSFFGGRPSHQ